MEQESLFICGSNDIIVSGIDQIAPEPTVCLILSESYPTFSFFSCFSIVPSYPSAILSPTLSPNSDNYMSLISSNTSVFKYLSVVKTRAICAGSDRK